MHDVVVIGAGPAGLALARSLVDRGVDTVVIAPDAPWHATYGAWRDDVAHCELGASLDSLVRGAWPAVRVVGTREHRIERPYLVFDNHALRASLSASVPMRIGQVEAVLHDVESSTVRLAGDHTVAARLVIDATGAGAFLAQSGRALGAQTAYGLVLRSEAMPADVSRHADVFTLMDWSSPPTFLYQAHFADGSVLLEETSLFAAPLHDIDDLRRRLATRLGADLTARASTVERVHIAMGVALPSRATRTVGFGAAAGYVHPVTGYSVAASLRAAPRVADAIRRALDERRSASELSQITWSAVWPADLVRTRDWHDMGLAVLRALPPADTPKFFDAFFSLPVEQSAAYLRVDGDARMVRAAMLGVFHRVDNRLRLRLASQPGALLRALVAR